MFGSAILEVAIGIVLVYLLLSVICTAAQEVLETWMKKRATNLEKGLRELLNDPNGTGLVDMMYNHPLIFGLFKGSYDPGRTRTWWLTSALPTYIPAANFATALMDIVARGPVSPAAPNGPQPAGELSFDSLRAAVDNSPALNPSIRRVMHLMLDSARGDLDRVQANLETWFNNGMDRVAGWYKRNTQWILLGIGVLLTVGLNVDSMRLATVLYQQDTLRAQVVAQAGAIAKDGKPPNDGKKAFAALEGLNLPIGWYVQQKKTDPPAVWCSVREIAPHIPGWLITAFAISLGAPFWFDLLNKFIVVRSTVKPQEKSQPEASKDPQTQSQQRSTQGPVDPRGAAGGTAGGTSAGDAGGAAAGAAGGPAGGTAADGGHDDEELDGCDCTVETVTKDEELPAAEGGVV